MLRRRRSRNSSEKKSVAAASPSMLASSRWTAKVTSENVPVDAEAMQRRQLPNVQLDERNDWWGGATYPGTDRPATLVHATWHTPRLTKQSHSGESARDASSDAA